MLTRDANGDAELGGVALASLFQGANAIETPAYVYDLDAMADAARALASGFGETQHLVAYAVKANSAGPVVRALAEAGCGAEVVSGGELALALACGVLPERILMSGVAKKPGEIDRALGAGERGILSLQIESVEEITRIAARAEALGRTARVSLRVNPSVETDTHAKVATGHDEAKFGVGLEDLDVAFEAIARAPRLRLVGLGCHVGSQLTATSAYLEAANVVLDIVEARRPPHLELLDFGGGFGVDYGAGCDVAPADFARGVSALVARRGHTSARIVVEPGRALVASFGVLVARVIGSKLTRSGRRWLLIDAGMNDLLRPALYGAHHRIEPMRGPYPSPDAVAFRVAGPVCESSDDFGAHRFAEPLPELVLLRDAGAYGFTMASEYNGRALPAEVFVSRGHVTEVKRPRSVDAWVEARR